MKAGFLEDLGKAKQAQMTAKGAMTVATNKNVLILFKLAFSGE
jgi:hypothetical protein